MSPYKCRVFSCALALSVAACAGARNGASSASTEEARAEQLRQQVRSIQSELGEQARLDNVAYPLLRSAIQLCGNGVAYRPEFRALTIAAYSKEGAAAARVTGMSDTLRVVTVTRGGAADRAGLLVGDQIVEVSGRPAPIGRNAMRDFGDYLRKLPQNDQSVVSLTVRRDSMAGSRAVAFPQDQMCGYGVISVSDAAVNAWADGDNVYVTSALQRFIGSSDEDLAVILSHAFAHNALNHAGARKRNSTIGALLGAAVDIAAASNGVNTGGVGQAAGGGAGNRAYSEEFEREADYVGLYMLARAGVRYENAAAVWQRMDREKPGSIQLLSNHATSVARFNRFEETVREIDRKKAAGQALLPTRK